jgi:putative hydrolase of the HAD superfamily
MKPKTKGMQDPEEKTLLEGIRVISLDVGFTLIYTDPPVGDVYASIAARFGCPVDPGETHTRFLNAWSKHNALNRAEYSRSAFADETSAFLWWKEIFKESVGDIAAPKKLEQMFEECYKEYALGELWRVYPDVRPGLDAIRAKGFRLVVLSNWDNRLLQTLAELELDSYFEKIYISTQIGFAKPNPGAFRHILKELCLQPSEMLHVGDSLVEDIEGAGQARVRAAWIDRQGKHPSASPGVPVISSLAELLSLKLH